MTTVIKNRPYNKGNQAVTEQVVDGVKTVLYGPAWEGEYANTRDGYWDRPHPASFLDGNGVRCMPLGRD